MKQSKIAGDALNPGQVYDAAVRDYRLDIEQSAIARMKRREPSASFDFLNI